jgi:DNA-binding MurR/RpiR family transcriptional regulator
MSDVEPRNGNVDSVDHSFLRDGESLSAQIRERYLTFSAGERQIADVLLGSPDVMSGATATELAAAARVSKATVTRFVSKLGLTNFDRFRQAFRADSAGDYKRPVTGAPLDLMDEELNATAGDLETLTATVLKSDRENLDRTFAELSIADLKKAVESLCTARNIIFADYRKQFALAHYAATLFRVIRPSVTTLPLLGASAVDGTLDFDTEDVIIMFPFRRPERDQNVLSQTVINAGAKLIAIGDVWPNPTNQRAHLYFRCHTEGTGVFDSFATPISLINLLFTATANQLGPSARDRLTLLEQRHQVFATFDW